MGQTEHGMNGMNRIIKSNDIELLLVLFPFFVPQYLVNLGNISTVIELYKISVFLYICGNIRRIDRDLPPVFYIVMIFKGLDLIPFLFGDSFSLRTIYLWIKDFYSTVFLCFIMFLACKKDYYNTVQKIYWILSLWIILHIICFYATGIELLGIRTKISHSFIVCLTLCLVNKELGGKKFKYYDYVFLGASIFYIVNRRISTVIVISAALFIGYFLSKMKFTQHLINYYALVATGIMLNLSFLFFRIQNFFKWIIVNLLNEDLTLNNRTIIWDDVIHQCFRKPWLGYGIMGENSRTVSVSIFDPELGLNIDSPLQVHNQVLSILYFNGIIGLCVFIAMLLAAGSRIKKCLNRRVVVILVFGMTSIILAAIAELSTENFSFYVLLMFIALCDYSNREAEVWKYES